MEITLEDIKDFLKQHDYLTEVFGINEYSCRATFPACGQLKKEEVIYQFDVDEGKLHVTIHEQKTTFLITEASYRLGIYLDIISRMKLRGIDRRIINFYTSNGEKVEKLADLLKPPEDMKKEMELGQIAARILNKKSN